MTSQPEHRAKKYPTCCRIGTMPTFQKVGYRRLGVSRGPDYPLPTNRVSVGYTEASHHSTNQLAQRARLPVNPFSTEESSQQFRYSEVAPTSTRGPHLNIQSWSTGTMQSRQRGRETKGNASRRCSQKIPRSFGPTSGRVSGQHAHGFLTRSRLVEKQQNTGYHNGKKNNLGKDDRNA